MIVTGRNVNWTYHDSVRLIRAIGQESDSRNGPVLTAPHPVWTTTENPEERVLFEAQRDANPFFHFFECLWMMSGSGDGRWLDRFVRNFSSRFAEFDGEIHGAYGQRWREHFGMDQLQECVRLLRENPLDRRVVVSMWDPDADLAADVADVPCNTHMYPRVREDRGTLVLDLTVCCRSNDIVWGATGANVVHFSFVQEWMAAQVGVGVGKLHQFSNNWHAYTNILDKVGVPEVLDLYSSGEVAPYPICDVPEAWQDDLVHFMEDPPHAGVYKNRFFELVALPMWLTHERWSEGDRDGAMSASCLVAATDWRMAAQMWMKRRMKK